MHWWAGLGEDGRQVERVQIPGLQRQCGSSEATTAINNVALLHIHIHALPASRGVSALQVLRPKCGDGGSNVCNLAVAGNHVARDLHAGRGMYKRSSVVSQCA